MIKPEQFYKLLQSNGVEFFTGVPDSLLKDICAYITEKTKYSRHIIAANEGNAVALASGYYLATEKIPLVYMQNSGIGNAINPLLSLADEDVYSIPMLLMIGWRGEPGIKDEPQHIKQGKVTLGVLDAMGIEYVILPDSFNEAQIVIEKSIQRISQTKCPFALIVKKNTFESYSLNEGSTKVLSISRENAIKVIVDHLEEDAIVVSTTGKASRELFEYRSQKGQGHQRDFLTVGSMGHANQIALTIALEKPNRNVYCFDGDGAVLMHTGGMGIIGDYKPQNLKHIIFNNGAHESVGGQPTIGFDVDFSKLAKGFNYSTTLKASSKEEIEKYMPLLKNTQGPILLEIWVSMDSRKDLGRPTISPKNNKNDFMRFLQDGSNNI
ncbi:MAG: phosphonopyruvate decarboxylase [Salinivirgaceae bacterium]|nr:phosphonopyruvate decarboxylase [Salinivirgaceae bacterium]